MRFMYAALLLVSLLIFSEATAMHLPQLGMDRGAGGRASQSEVSGWWLDP
jgi:hypothetical protein